MVMKLMSALTIVTAFSFVSANNSNVTQDTIAYWDFSDKTPGTVTEVGQRIRDRSGNNRDLVVLGAIDGTTPVFSDAGPYRVRTGSAMQFLTQFGEKLVFIPGYSFNDEGSSADSNPIAFQMNQSWTIEFAICMPKFNIGYHSPFNMYKEGSYEFFWTRFSTTGFQWLARMKAGGGTTGATVGQNMFDDQWHHLAMTRNTATSPPEISVYIDYQKVYDGLDNTAMDWPFDRFYIGGWNNQSDRDLIGSLAFVRISDKALSPESFIQPDPPAATNPSPTNYAQIPAGQCILSWTPMVELTDQRLLFGSDPAMQDVIVFTPSGNTASVLTEPLKKYYWRIEAQDLNGCWYISPIWSFSTPTCAFGKKQGDFTENCSIDFHDLVILCTNWLRANEHPTIQSPYNFGSYQHKIQLHCHTTNSDGDYSSQWIMQTYQNAGYAAVAITDHDHTKYTPSLSDPGGHSIIHIPGVEYSYDDSLSSWNHMIGINIRTIYHFSGYGQRQAQIDQAHLEGGFTFLAHPHDYHPRGWSTQEILEISGYDGIEIHNGGSDQELGIYSYKVDCALQSGRNIYLIAVDDFHTDPEKDIDRGAIVINSSCSAQELTVQDIASALKSGNFFSIGRRNALDPVPPIFTNISIQGHSIVVEMDKKVDIEFITNQHNCYISGNQNYSQIVKNSEIAKYDVQQGDKYIRIRAVYTENTNKSYAWSNPIYVIR